MNKKDIRVWMRGLKNFFNNIVLELCYPNTCVICGVLCKDGLCGKCEKEYPVIQEPRCKKCGKPIVKEEDEYCEDCLKGNHIFLQGKNIWIHTKQVKETIYRFKYKNHRIYAKEYARILVLEHAEFLQNWRPECMIPVPAHAHRKRKRGYNQADVLCYALQKQVFETFGVKIPVYNHIIYRKRETKFQKQLNQSQRRQNLVGAFSANAQAILPRHVLLVDDIYTTGSTINEMAKVCIALGGKEVIFMTISIGQGF